MGNSHTRANLINLISMSTSLLFDVYLKLFLLLKTSYSSVDDYFCRRVSKCERERERNFENYNVCRDKYLFLGRKHVEYVTTDDSRILVIKRIKEEKKNRSEKYVHLYETKDIFVVAPTKCPCNFFFPHLFLSNSNEHELFRYY